MSQSFTADLSGLLTGIDVSLFRDAGETGEVTLAILADPTDFASVLFSAAIPIASINLDSPGAFIGPEPVAKI